MPSDLKQRILKATEKSLKTRNRYSDSVTAQLTQALKKAEQEVAQAILKYKSLGSLPDNQLARLSGLEKLQGELGDVTRTLKKQQTLIFRKSTKEAFKGGIAEGIGELTSAQLPFYADLTPGGIDKLATKAFTIVDTNALDFMAQYNLTLAGDVNRELADGIQRTILNGIATGKGADDIVRDLGSVIVDKDSFRQAGTRVFSKAQYRMEMIARTEILRAHNMGRLKFHERVGVQKLEWMTMGDERTCPVCGPLNGQTYLIDKFPQQPAHPHCRCTNMVAWPMTICGSDMSAQAAPTAIQGDACILPPHVVEGMADAQAAEEKQLKQVFENGSVDGLKGLTAKQLQTLAKGNGVSVARTKADFIKLLDKADPGVDHSGLAGAALKAKLKEHKIGLLRTKDELIELLSQKQAQLKQAQMVAQQMAKLPPVEGLDGMTAKQLKEMAKGNSISLNMTKQETIELLDKLEPGIDHTGLKGQELLAKKKQHGIGILKNKQQLIDALQKKEGSDLAESAKQQAVDEAKKLLIKKQMELVKNTVSGVQVPDSPLDYGQFISQLGDAEKALSSATDLSQDLLAGHAKEIALKKKLFQDQVTKLKASELKNIAKESKLKHWQWAGKDDLVTIFTETDPSKVDFAKQNIETKWSKWAEKYSGKKKLKPKAPAKAPNPKPEPQKKPVFAKKGSEYDEADLSWKKKPASAFKKSGKADVGGAHEKEFWTDENGEKWLFKPAKNSSDNFIAHGEEAAYKIGRLIDPDAIEVRTIQLNGRTGSIQKWRTDLKSDFDFRGVLPENLSTLEIEQLQREHVVDWLIANHDGHSKQFIRATDGQVYGIDKGQAFKFLGKDQLSLNYHPNRNCGEAEPFYNTVFRAAKDGKVNFDPNVTLKYIQEVEKFSDESYLDMIRPYAEGRFGKNKAGLNQFYEQALDRKHNLHRDFESYYGEVLGQKGFRFDTKKSTVSAKKLLQAADEALIEDAGKLGWQGKTLPFDSGDVEDQNALIFTEMFNGKPRTVVKMKIRPDTDGTIVSKLQGQLDRVTIPKGKPLKEDSFYTDILEAVKNVNYHSTQSGKYNQTKLDKAMILRNKLGQLAKSDDPNVRKMAENYVSWLDQLDDAVKNKKITKGTFEQYLPEAPKPKKQKKPDFKVKKGSVTHTKREIKNGEILVDKDGVNNSTIFRGRSVKGGVQYTAEFDDGTRINYRPWKGDNLYAQRGEMEITIDGKVSPNKMESLMDKLDQLGIDARVASPENAEQMYLEKMAYIRKVDHKADFKRLQKGLDDREASTTERVQAMREYWQKELKVDDLTKLPDYDPMGAYQAGFLDRKLKGGYRNQFRFDISEQELEEKMKGHSLVHSLTNSEKMSDFVETIMQNNGAMVSTVEKMRMGIPPGGMSPVADMNSGGASYFFTRIKKNPSSHAQPALYFKKSMLRRMDAISYNHDAYGKVVDGYVKTHRGSDIADWKQFSSNSGNETIFKYSVTLLDNIEYIVTHSTTEQKKVIQSFVNRGITKLPDGRKIEDMVRTSDNWSSRK
ncbi:phage head morphogenesis protein [Verrucomicrobia bacterium S94]|nr:phage head morphogenesis protein [Verrucomicrobia bacterium S94]